MTGLKCLSGSLRVCPDDTLLFASVNLYLGALGMVDWCNVRLFSYFRKAFMVTLILFRVGRLFILFLGLISRFSMLSLPTSSYKKWGILMMGLSLIL